MTKVICIRAHDCSLVPLDDEEAAKIKRAKQGAAVTIDMHVMRNERFFRKWWALAKLAYNIWQETLPAQVYKGVQVQPNFDRFRRDLTIMSGHYKPVFAANGELRLEADSLSFGAMDEATFEALYSATINAILTKVLACHTSMTEAKIRKHVDDVMRFD
jgi:hypothetical protein